MILPSKHIYLSESLIGLGAFVISLLNIPTSIDECWKQLKETYLDTGVIKKKHNFDNFVMTVELLFIMGVVDINEKGELVKCT